MEHASSIMPVKTLSLSAAGKDSASASLSGSFYIKK
jgi:hypothetical protein